MQVSVEKAAPTDIRPGCTAAFQLHDGFEKGQKGGEDHVGIVAEVRDDKMSLEVRQNAYLTYAG